MNHADVILMFGRQENKNQGHEFSKQECSNSG